MLLMDDLLRALEGLPRGARRLFGNHRSSAPLRHAYGNQVRDRISNSIPAADVASIFGDRVDRALRDIPQPGEGVVVRTDGGDPAHAFERFLAIADGEGFAGDRPLFVHAQQRLTALVGLDATFVYGFVLPTFDAVEARFVLGPPIGGCSLPLVPSVYVGVGVTPGDDLEVWAAPAVGEPSGGVAATWDDGSRAVLGRDAGMAGLQGALDDALADAHERLAGLLARSRAATRLPVEDVRTALRPLHLPRSFVEAAVSITPGAPGHHLDLALRLTRAAEDAAPLVARKLALAAGRLLAAVPPDRPGCPPA
jgi:hypothetical protein